MARERRYTVPVRTRVTEKVGAALRAAADRDNEIGAIVRRMIETSLGTKVEDLSPLVRRRRPVEHAALLAEAVRLLGSVSGNLQRFYTMAAAVHGIDDRELLTLKAEVAKVSRQIREAIGGGADA